MPDPTLTPPTAAELYAALVALRAGLDDRIAAARDRVLADAAPTKAKAFATQYGPVNIVRKPEGVGVHDDAGLIAYAEKIDPTGVETVKVVRSTTRAALMARLAIVAGEVVDTVTGEVVPWAYVTDEGQPFVAYPASKEQRDAKEYARMLFEESEATLAARLREVTA